MHSMLSHMLAVSTLALASLTSLPASAQPASAPSVQATGTLPQVDGEIRKVDAATGKITIRHADIPNLGMGAMTMVFRATPALVSQAKEGDKVSFTADRVDGALTVMSLQPAH